MYNKDIHPALQTFSIERLRKEQERALTPILAGRMSSFGCEPAAESHYCTSCLHCSMSRVRSRLFSRPCARCSAIKYRHSSAEACTPPC